METAVQRSLGKRKASLDPDFEHGMEQGKKRRTEVAVLDEENDDSSDEEQGSEKENAFTSLIKRPSTIKIYRRAVPIAKSTKASDHTTTDQMLTEIQLAECTREELVDRVVALQKELSEHKKAESSPRTSPPTTSPATTNQLTPEDLSKKTSQLRDIIARKLRKAMVWTPSCKTGKARFAEEFPVSSLAVLAALFKNVDTDGKAWKMKKLSSEDFQNKVVRQDVSGSVRYATLNITSDVNCRWVEVEGLLKIGGSYGKIC